MSDSESPNASADQEVKRALSELRTIQRLQDGAMKRLYEKIDAAASEPKKKARPPTEGVLRARLKELKAVLPEKPNEMKALLKVLHSGGPWDMRTIQKEGEGGWKNALSYGGFNGEWVGHKYGFSLHDESPEMIITWKKDGQVTMTDGPLSISGRNNSAAVLAIIRHIDDRAKELG